MNEPEHDPVQNAQRWAFIIGVIALIACAIGWVTEPAQFFLSYLAAFLIWLGVALGSLSWAMIHYLTGGRWGYAVRRFFEAAMSTLPLLLLLFVPVFFGLSYLYPWTHAAERTSDEVLRHRQAYMNMPSFVLRAIVVFAVWIALAHLLTKWSGEQDATRNPEPTKKLRKLSGPGLVVYPISVTFAFVDWVMSMEADWFSTMFPILICVGQMLSALAFSILLLAWLERRTGLAQITGQQTFHNFGNLLLTLTMMWAYLAFSQLLIIWSGDLPHEISWYLHRIAGGWKAIAAFLFLFHFFVPFLVLLSRRNKRRLGVLTSVAAMIFIAHAVDVWWLVTPSIFKTGIHVSWLDFAAFLGVGGIWFTVFLNRLQTKAIVPLNDPRFAVAATV